MVFQNLGILNYSLKVKMIVSVKEIEHDFVMVHLDIIEDNFYNVHNGLEQHDLLAIYFFDRIKKIVNIKVGIKDEEVIRIQIKINKEKRIAVKEMKKNISNQGGDSKRTGYEVIVRQIKVQDDIEIVREVPEKVEIKVDLMNEVEVNIKKVLIEEVQKIEIEIIIEVIKKVLIIEVIEDKKVFQIEVDNIVKVNKISINLVDKDKEGEEVKIHVKIFSNMIVNYYHNFDTKVYLKNSKNYSNKKEEINREENIKEKDFRIKVTKLIGIIVKEGKRNIIVD